MRVVAWDSWAFVEVALAYARGNEVRRLWEQTDLVVTSRDVVAETFNFITGKARRNEEARDWLQAANASRVRVVDPDFEAVCGFIEAHPEASLLSWTDYSLAYVADQAGARQVATTDAGFNQLGFDAIFAVRK